MALIGEVVELKQLVRTETASSCIKLRRSVSQGDKGVVNEYPVSIAFGTHTFEVDKNGKKLRILGYQANGELYLDQAQLVELWGTPLTLADGTKTTLGELIAYKADQLVEQHILAQKQ